MPLPRTFARVRAFDIACPRCSAVSILSAHQGGRGDHPQRRRHAQGGLREWDWTTGRWQCRSCGLVCSIGVVVWKHPKGGAQPPGDRVPSVVEGEALRGLLTGEHVGTGGRARGNLEIETEPEGNIADDPKVSPRQTIAGDAFTDLVDDSDDENGHA